MDQSPKILDFYLALKGGEPEPQAQDQSNQKKQQQQPQKLPAAYEEALKRKEIWFYSVHEVPFGIFSNFSQHTVTYNSIAYPSSEHMFQALKFLDKTSHDMILSQPTSKLAAEKGRDRSLKLRSDWEKVKNHVMFQAVFLKFWQHKDIQDVLLASDGYKIVEHTKNDSYWADGGDGNGKNMLGRLLELVRHTIKLIRLSQKDSHTLSDEEALKVANTLFLDWPDPTANQSSSTTTATTQQSSSTTTTPSSVPQTPSKVVESTPVSTPQTPAPQSTTDSSNNNNNNNNNKSVSSELNGSLLIAGAVALVAGGLMFLARYRR